MIACRRRGSDRRARGRCRYGDDPQLERKRTNGVSFSDTKPEGTAMRAAELKRGTARDIMTANPTCATPSMTIRELARLLEDNQISGASVVDRERRVIGVVSRNDLRGVAGRF